MEKKILVTGGNGLVGSSINSDIKIGKQYDLRNTQETNKMRDEIRGYGLKGFDLSSIFKKYINLIETI